jgi:hypothetical protein
VAGTDKGLDCVLLRSATAGQDESCGPRLSSSCVSKTVRIEFRGRSAAVRLVGALFVTRKREVNCW